MKTGSRLVCGMVASCALMAAPMAGRAQDKGAETPTNLTPPPADLRNFEGVWKPAMGGPPPAAKGGPGGAPPGGPPGGGARTPETASSIAGTELVCAPMRTTMGGGGGTSTLWVQDAKEIVMINEEGEAFRQIFLRAKHPAKIIPDVNGNSIGHWEGNTLAVDTIGFAGKDGKATGEHTVEHIARQGTKLVDHVVSTIDGVTTQQDASSDWRPDLQVWESTCEEGYSQFQLIGGKLDDVNN